MNAVARSSKQRNQTTARSASETATTVFARPYSLGDDLHDLLIEAGIPVSKEKIKTLSLEERFEAGLYAEAKLRIERGRPAFLPGGSTEIPADEAPLSGPRASIRVGLPYADYTKILILWDRCVRRIGDDAADAAIQYEKALDYAENFMTKHGAHDADLDDLLEYREAARAHARSTVESVRDVVRGIEGQMADAQREASAS